MWCFRISSVTFFIISPSDYLFILFIIYWFIQKFNKRSSESEPRAGSQLNSERSHTKEDHGLETSTVQLIGMRHEMTRQLLLLADSCSASFTVFVSQKDEAHIRLWRFVFWADLRRSVRFGRCSHHCTVIRLDLMLESLWSLASFTLNMQAWTHSGLLESLCEKAP